MAVTYTHDDMENTIAFIKHRIKIYEDGMEGLRQSFEKKEITAAHLADELRKRSAIVSELNAVLKSIR